MLKRRLKEPFGKAGLTVAICALVLAMVGGAYAAGGLTKAQEKQVTKIAKKYAGKPGATGPAGPAGPAGAAGAAGAAGKNGTNGTNGTNGANGSPWTAGGTLPSKQTETGMWGFSTHTEGRVIETISFPIPLQAALDPEAIHLILPNGKELEVGGEEEELTASTQCPGDFTAPTAKPGSFCLYAIAYPEPEELNPGEPRRRALNVLVLLGFSPTGILAEFNAKSSEGLSGQNGLGPAGSWAVTAP